MNPIAMPSWSATDGWRVPRRARGWGASDAWAQSFKSAMAAAGEQLDECLRAWDERLTDIDGDPSRVDWTNFRPLRLSREEDWSDWLAHLVLTAGSGRFAARLLTGEARDVERWRVLEVDREVSTPAGYRADIVFRFREGSWAHVEVKIGDLDLEKTFSTTDALRGVEQGELRGEYVLILASDVGYWNAVKSKIGGRADAIGTITWNDVAAALRAELLERDESTRWRVWAATFLGAIEQRLLGYQCVGTDDIANGKYRLRGRDVERIDVLATMLKERA